MKKSSDSGFRILLAEDEDLLRWSIQRFFEKRGFVVEGVKNGDEGVDKARVGSYDLLITDLRLGGVDGLQVASVCREHNPELQTIVITGQGSKESAIAAIRQGVWDYVEKPLDLQRLLFTIEKALDKRRMERELVRLSRTDGLTGLYNQRYFYEVLNLEMRRAHRQNTPISIILLDVDKFKEYNDHYGHIRGDECLIDVARVLRICTQRTSDLIARYGGEEFVALLPDSDLEGGLTVAEDCLQAIADAAIEHLGSEVAPYITVSIGVAAMLPIHDKSSTMLIEQADIALYQAKQNGRNQLCSFSAWS